MSNRKRRLYSIFNNKCPACYKGNFFKSNNPYRLREFDKMNERCPVCGEDFEREPGFYYGAMYASYGLNVILGLFVFVLFVWVLDLSPLRVFLPVFPFLVILLLPLIYRLSRLIWINLFPASGKNKMSAQPTNDQKSQL